MRPARFKALLLDGHKGCACEVPFDPGERWGLEKQRLRPGRFGFPVRGTIDGTEFESAIVPRAKSFWLELEARLLNRAKLVAGTTAAFVLEPRA